MVDNVKVKRAKPKKPERPVHSVGLGTMVSEHFNPDGEIEELEWAEKFVTALAAQGGEKLTVAGRAPDPADVLLTRGGEGLEVHLQITEAVDLHRLQMTERRTRYTKAIWAAATGMKDVFKGLKIFVDEAGGIMYMPEPDSPAGMALVRQFSEYFAGCIPRFTQLAVGSGLVGKLTEPTTGIELQVRAGRYAPAGAESPAKWLWAGPVRFMDTPIPDYISDVVVKKLKRYGVRNGPNPLWLLAFTRDCTYDSDQEAKICAATAAGPNPFGRIFLLKVPDAYPVRQIFPLVADPKTDPGPKPSLVLLMGHDYFAQHYDTRFRAIE